MHDIDPLNGSADDTARPVRPGWPELVTGLLSYLLLIQVGVAWMTAIPDEQSALRGIVGYIVSGGAGIGAFLVAFSIRIRNVRPFGFKRVRRKWVLIAIGIAIVLYAANYAISIGYVLIFGNDNPQGDYHAAASGGTIALISTIVTGAVLTPIGEELIFRGVIANTLNRYGWWAGVLLSSVIFATMHGFNLIFFSAILVGLASATLFRKTGSIWPSIVIHMTYNLIGNLTYALVAAN